MTATSGVKGLGTAFGTKVLYWASRRHNHAVLPLIYDKRVHGALWSLDARWGQGERFDHPWECVRYASYASYCNGAERAASELNDISVTAKNAWRSDDIELWLFQAGRKRAGERFSGCRDGAVGGGPEAENDSEVDDYDPDDPWPVLVEINRRIGRWG